jgi:hypothetical protein
MDFRALVLVKIVFDFAKELSGINLKPTKCNLIPLNQVDPNCEDDIKERDFIKAWLTLFIPEWVNFVVDLCAKYLGFYMGPKSLDKIWAAPVCTWIKRSKEIAFSHMNSSLSSRAYNSRAIPVLGYIGQLHPLTPPCSKKIRSSPYDASAH